ncbi:MULTISPECIES: hypothetical protein [Streptomyces]|uniref:hypothetical protein n=1 Tax=Streptomyces TaxID=1883 RepID=UPI0030D4A59B
MTSMPNIFRQALQTALASQETVISLLRHQTGAGAPEEIPVRTVDRMPIVAAWMRSPPRVPL